MSAAYVSLSMARRAEEIQHDHKDNGAGWCEFHRRNHGTLIRFGECKPYRLAQKAIDAYLQQERERPSPVLRVEFRRPRPKN